MVFNLAAVKKMSAKKRKYNEEYLQYGFTDAAENGQVVPQCVICFEKLSNDALRPNRLKRHLQTKHPLHQTKPLNFFQSKKDSFKKMKIICAENFGQSSSAEVVEASYEIAQMISQAKKTHNIGETLIKPCMLKASSLVLGETNSKKLAKISLLDSTIKRRIDELANDIDCQVLQQIQASPYFAIQCNETTDVAQFSQLMVYVRFVGSATIEEEMLFCKPLETTTKAEDEFRLVDAYFHKNDMKWEKFVGVCTDGGWCTSDAWVSEWIYYQGKAKESGHSWNSLRNPSRGFGLQDFTCCNEEQACHSYTNCKLYQIKCCQFPVIFPAM